MATYEQIAEFVNRRHDRTVKTCWIAHVKELNGLPIQAAPNRDRSGGRSNPCPPPIRPLIEEAMRHFGMIA